MSKKRFNPKARQNEIVIQLLKDELLVYDLKSNKAFCLNKTAAAVWQNCDGNSSALDLKRKVGAALGSAPGDDLLWFAIAQLQNHGLIEPESEIEDRFSGLTRREVVKSFGLASAVALPLIASVAAPKALSAQSDACVPLVSGCQCVNGYSSGQDCTGDTQFNNCPPGCRCIASPGFDDCMP